MNKQKSFETLDELREYVGNRSMFSGNSNLISFYDPSEGWILTFADQKETKKEVAYVGD